MEDAVEQMTASLTGYLNGEPWDFKGSLRLLDTIAGLTPMAEELVKREDGLAKKEAGLRRRNLRLWRRQLRSKRNEFGRTSQAGVGNETKGEKNTKPLA
ncbi:hypothetical protein G7Y89_g10179 [Cudoniella acicularis]|uniref:Uncharacterized protein n=1 Tax=Cudoniella acicularis TaxID=354080 RepID=A0A8H4W1W2_9HELO|nr:hypothetical protein G7Y89_g10179 [Cudoniella acicularis]